MSSSGDERYIESVSNHLRKESTKVEVFILRLYQRHPLSFNLRICEAFVQLIIDWFLRSKEIEKLRLEQVEDKRLHNENERVTAQLGRQVAEHRAQSEHLLAETKRLTENFETAKVGKRRLLGG